MSNIKLTILPQQLFSLPWEPRISFADNRTAPPSAAGSAIATPQFRPLTEADVQDALAQVKAAADALDQRFATAGP